MEPRVPERLHPLAREVLEALRSQAAAARIILGGGVALQHYCPHRDTVDLDAWWDGGVDAAAAALIEEAMRAVGRRHGMELQTRSWRETQSYELVKDGRKAFSFQISLRTVQLDPPLRSAWDPVRIESFRDNLGAKMNALVERGAPRDVLDIYEVCRRGLARVEDCWRAWAAKNPNVPLDAARLRVLHHLELLEARRPLPSIQDAAKREEARRVREWVRRTLCARAQS